MPSITVAGTTKELPQDDSVASKVPLYNEAIQLLATEAEAPTPQKASVYHSANQSITSATLTALAFNSERSDTDTIHDTVTNNSRLTCKTAGFYRIVAAVAFAAAATGQRAVLLRVGGSTYIAKTTIPTIGAGAETVITISRDWQLAVNDYVECVVYQDSGGAVNVLSAASYSPEFSCVRLGA